MIDKLEELKAICVLVEVWTSAQMWAMRAMFANGDGYACSGLDLAQVIEECHRETTALHAKGARK